MTTSDVIRAALDVLHAVQLDNDRLRAQLREIRDQRARYAREVFPEAAEQAAGEAEL